MFDAIERAAAKAQDAMLLIGRCSLAAIFFQSGFLKLMDINAFAAMLASQGVPIPEVLAVIGVAFEVAGAIGVVLGFRTRLAALLLIFFTVGATLIAHHFWTLDGSARSMQAIHFMKNIAIIGGFLLLAAAGPGRFSLDRRTLH